MPHSTEPTAPEAATRTPGRAPLRKLRGHYRAVQRNGGYYLQIPEAYSPAGVVAEDWAADLLTLRETLEARLDPRVEVSTQVGELLWRFSATNGSLNTSASFQGRAQALPKSVA